MTTDLTLWVADRLDASDLDDEVGLVVLAALESDTALDAYLEEATEPESVKELLTSGGASAPAPVGAYLSSLRVQGFRGIGAEVIVPLTAAPGLTVIAGRNGSGKSSLAEALELLLTGGTYRWKNKPAMWREQWRNLHTPDPASVVLEVASEGREPVTLCTTWEDGVDDVDARTTWAQTKGSKRVAGDDPLGWHAALETYRPILSYDELGGLLESGPSQLYDALATVLGVEQLADALKRLQVRLKTAKAPGTDLDRRRKDLVVRAKNVADERADRLVGLLAKRGGPDVEAVTGLVTGIEPVADGPVAALQTLTHLRPPDEAIVLRAAATLRSAVEALASAGETVSQRTRDRLDVRRRALTVHEAHGDMSCPVCDTGNLDDTWAATARGHLARADEEHADLLRATADLRAARDVVRRLLAPRPRALDGAPLDRLDDVVAATRTAWDAWVSDVPAGDLDLADRLTTGLTDLEAVTEILRAEATTALRELDDAWSPLAAQAAAWSVDFAGWRTGADARARLTAAESWLKATDTVAKNERIKPIAAEARAAWAKLRQESNVELGELTLEGTATRRRVEIRASVDGHDTGALPVMSQGELHALALALFLPRATTSASPFRFVVLDDPVQAMDPAKVEGLVELLADLARTHQVIVLSHDDRLPAAVRRLQVSAHVLEVSRGTDSTVQVATLGDPAARYLDDAYGLVRDSGLPDDTMRRTLPGLLRLAVESAARDRLVATRLARGEKLVEIEDLWSRHRKTGERVSLAIYDEVRSLDGWLRAPYRKQALGCATSALHQGLRPQTDPTDAVYDTRRMVADVRYGTK
ncbi:AAA family ATPase [Nocardioides dongxiaopingii]|uniref:AAA family ATPase n=1 Tax=Nocardioides sp. S-1144 TaxID=2582905 RepID=UPI00165244D3|nr:AAA family ATPase [Nocardioides sp. S-1144]